MTLTATKKIAIPALVVLMAMMSVAVAGALPASAEVDNDQGTVSYNAYVINFAFKGTDAESILWDFGFNNEDGSRAQSTEWNPQGIVFPEKGIYIVTQVVTNSVGSYTSQLKVEILGTPEITFQTFGGSSVDMQVVKVGNTVTQPADPVKDGQNFAGWYTDTAFTEKYDFSTPVSTSMTLYAKWSITPVTDEDDKKDSDNGNNGNDDDKDDDKKDGSTQEYIPILAGILGFVLLGAYMKDPEGRRPLGIAGAAAIAIAILYFGLGIDVIGMLSGADE